MSRAEYSSAITDTHLRLKSWSKIETVTIAMHALKPASVAGIFFQFLTNVLDMAIEYSMRLRIIVAERRNKQLLARKCMARFLSHTKQDVELIGSQA